MSVRAALRHALRDLYEQSWRLVVLNTALAAAVLAVLVLGSYAPAAFVLGVGVGPLVAALMHCAVCIVRDEELRLGHAVEGVRMHWRRGLELAALAGLVVLAGAVAVRTYGSSGRSPGRSPSSSRTCSHSSWSSSSSSGRSQSPSESVRCDGCSRTRARRSCDGRPQRSGSRSHCC